MNSISLMKIPCGFKIRKKADCKKFLNECVCKGNSYMVPVSKTQLFWIEVDKDKNVSISEKCGDLNDMFNPLVEVARTKDNCYDVTVEDAIWQIRKYINAKWFSKKN